jgi:glycosyltransferase involved in cell wall biosynthesis
MRVLIFGHTGSNALSRIYNLSLVFEVLDWEVDVIGATTGPIWEPLRDSAFAARCHSPNSSTISDLERDVDLILAAKVLPETVIPALRTTKKTRAPFLIDIDDSDWEIAFGGSLRRRARKALQFTSELRWPWVPYVIRHVAQRSSVIASNPVLARTYDGTVIPHVAVSSGTPARYRPQRAFSVYFVGTPRRHKGIEILREAARSVGMSLTVTGSIPDDGGFPNETWLGSVDLHTAAHLTRTADIIAVPSLDTLFSRSQLPIKLIEAMMAARPIIASDLENIRWALGDTGVLVPPGDPVALAVALNELRDVRWRRQLGVAAQARARRLFMPEIVAETLQEAIHAAGKRR